MNSGWRHTRVETRSLMVRTLTGLIVVGLLSGCAVAEGEEADEEAGESEDQLLAGRRVPIAEVAEMLRDNSIPEADVNRLVCAARYESNYYERARGSRNRNGTYDYGLFQINTVHLGKMKGCPGSVEGLYNAAANTKCAAAVYRAQGINAWYGYQRHRATCDAYRVPSGGSGANPVPPAGDEGDCYSSTIGSRVESGECVQALKDRKWYQCVDGNWAKASVSSGPKGACTEAHAL
jgi:hypothetical protein